MFVTSSRRQTRLRSPHDMPASPHLSTSSHLQHHTSRHARPTTQTRPHANTTQTPPFRPPRLPHTFAAALARTDRSTEETEEGPIPAYHNPAQMLDTSLRFGASIGKEMGKETPRRLLYLHIFRIRNCKESGEIKIRLKRDERYLAFAR
jgi:hypothetical protein